MTDCKEKSPRPRQRHMGDVTMGSPPIVYPERAPDVKGLRTRDELEEQRDNLIYELSQLDTLQSMLAGSSIEATARCIDYRACAAAAEEELNEVRQRLAGYEAREAREAELNEAEREAEYRRAVL